MFLAKVLWGRKTYSPSMFFPTLKLWVCYNYAENIENQRFRFNNNHPWLIIRYLQLVLENTAITMAEGCPINIHHENWLLCADCKQHTVGISYEVWRVQNGMIEIKCWNLALGWRLMGIRIDSVHVQLINHTTFYTALRRSKAASRSNMLACYANINFISVYIDVGWDWQGWIWSKTNLQFRRTKKSRTEPVTTKRGYRCGCNKWLSWPKLAESSKSSLWWRSWYRPCGKMWVMVGNMSGPLWKVVGTALGSPVTAIKKCTGTKIIKEISRMGLLSMRVV